MARVRAAATAPASPSSQDYAVAAAAASIAAAARQEQRAQVITEQTQENTKKEKKTEATAELDAQAAQTDSPRNTSSRTSTVDAARESPKVLFSDAQPSSQRTQQQKAVGAYQTSAGVATTSLINQNA